MVAICDNNETKSLYEISIIYFRWPVETGQFADIELSANL